MSEIDKLTSETKQEYQEESKKYFRNLGTPKNLGPSADDISGYAQHLPSKREEAKKAEYYAKGFGKATRSGAFSKSNSRVGHGGIFPSGLKFATDFIDEMTPGKYKAPPKAFQKLEKQEQTKQSDAPKPACIITEVCMDCMKPIDYTAKTSTVNGEQVPGIDAVVNLGFITQTNTHMLHALGLMYGDPFCSMFHATCMEKVKEFRKHNSPLVMGGALLSDKDRDTLLRWKNILKIHDGREITTGQWMAIKRLERVAVNTQDYIIEQRKIGNISIFRDDRKEK